MRGKQRGKAIELHQFCNDWATDEEGHIHAINNLEYRDDEIARINRSNDLKQCGMMFMMFHWNKNKLVKNKYA